MKRIFAALLLTLFMTGPALAGVGLSWQDNSDNEDGFRIYRAASLFTPFVQIGEVGANVTTFSDPDGRVGHVYRVTGFNAAGESQPSNNGGLLIIVPSGPGNTLSTTLIP